jgi:ABC-type antimicrobial peptide transport system permease subunit
MKLPTNGVAKEIRHYVGSLFIFLLIIGIVFILMQYPVLETNKEVVMMLIGTLSASIGLVVSTITGAKPDDVNALKSEVDKKQSQIDFLTKAKDDLEEMIMQLQKQMLDNQDDVMDKVILKAALDFDDRAAALKALNKNKE